MNRRRFLKLSGVGIAGSALLGVTGSGSVLAQEPSPGSSLVEEFEKAAAEYGVPKGLLMAMGYVNTRWEMPPPEASNYEEGDIHGWGGYGIMHLVKNPSADTLGAAAELTGIPEDTLMTDRGANILGGAALLAASQGRGRPTRLGEWFGAVAGRGRAPGRPLEAPSGIGGGELYAGQVFGVLEAGASATTRNGERIVLEARGGLR
ncbi:MAG: hypothetical protein M3P70_11615 [Actinomycetota bacterium]|nr:hypothetical protein [Actinomycetota bacterium]